jgi:hypothetical protein
LETCFGAVVVCKRASEKVWLRTGVFACMFACMHGFLREPVLVWIKAFFCSSVHTCKRACLQVFLCGGMNAFRHADVLEWIRASVQAYLRSVFLA